MVMQIKPIVVVDVFPCGAFPLVNFKGTVEQTFIFLDTPDLRSYKKTHGQAVVQKEDPVTERIVITDNAWKMCQTHTSQNLLAG